MLFVGGEFDDKMFCGTDTLTLPAGLVSGGIASAPAPVDPTPPTPQSVVTITQQPQNTSALYDETATFTIAAESSTGAELHYQWQTCFTQLEYNEWDDKGYDDPTLSLLVQFDKGWARCIVTDSNGGRAVSDIAKITVLFQATGINVYYNGWEQDFVNALQNFDMDDNTSHSIMATSRIEPSHANTGNDIIWSVLNGSNVVTLDYMRDASDDSGNRGTLTVTANRVGTCTIRGELSSGYYKDFAVKVAGEKQVTYNFANGNLAPSSDYGEYATTYGNMVVSADGIAPAARYTTAYIDVPISSIISGCNRVEVTATFSGFTDAMQYGDANNPTALIVFHGEVDNNPLQIWYQRSDSGKGQSVMWYREYDGNGGYESKRQWSPYYSVVDGSGDMAFTFVLNLDTDAVNTSMTLGGANNGGTQITTVGLADITDILLCGCDSDYSTAVTAKSVTIRAYNE